MRSVDALETGYYISPDIEMAKPLSATVHALKALAHPGRLRILAMLRGRELCVCQMAAVLDLAASTVSAHLADLKRAGLVAERKDGRWVFHRLEEGDVAKALLEPVWRSIAGDPQIAADERLLRDLSRVAVEELCRVNLDLKRLGIRRPPALETAARRS
jgi:DNA-binding transcriptional ArsR family regulator